jgi:hypothetical protein
VLSLATLVLNLIAILGFVAMAIMETDPNYVGATIATWVFLLELVLLLAIKHKQRNFNFTSSSGALFVTIGVIFIAWVIMFKT